MPTTKTLCILELLGDLGHHNINHKQGISPIKNTSEPTKMISFCLLHLLGDDQACTLSLEVDNAVGHGNHQEEARRMKRQRSREQSQHYMCRKPRRTADDCPTTPMPSTISRGTERSYSPMSVTDFRPFDESAKLSNANNGLRNALKPVRRSSVKVLSVSAMDGLKSSHRENHRLGRGETSSLANILSTLELQSTQG